MNSTYSKTSLQFGAFIREGTGLSTSRRQRRQVLASATAKTTAARACVVSILALALVGCASMAPVPFEEIGPGDRVSVTTKDGRTLAFEVVEVADGSIRGEAAEVPLDQIVSVRAMRTDSGRTALAVLGAVTVAYVLVAADVADKIIDSVSTLDE